MAAGQAAAVQHARQQACRLVVLLMAGCVCWWKQCHSRTLSGDQDDREDTGHEDDEVAGGLPDGGVQPADTFHACEVRGALVSDEVLP